MSQSKSWTFTIYNHDEKSVDDLESKCATCDLLCFQEEKCPESGRLHLQGYVRFSTNKRLRAVKSWLGADGAHCEVAKGSPRENLVYCTKDESATGEFRFQHGDFDKGGQGDRTDLHAVSERVRANASMEDLNEEFPIQVIKFGRGIQLSRSLFLSRSSPSTFPRCCIVLWGRSGSGKSLWARQFAQKNGLSVYSKNLTKSSDTQFFDGYDGESVLLLDDFTDQAVSYRELLIWTDIYKHRIQVKGAMCVAQWSHVIITSNVDPGMWYDRYVGAEREPLNRRLDYTLQAPPYPHFCESSHDLDRSYPGRSPPSFGAAVGRGDDGKVDASHPGGDERRVVSSPSFGSQGFVDPRDDPSFEFTDGASEGSSDLLAVHDRQEFFPRAQARSLWDGASPPYYNESD